ncbi:hypothetical protein BDF20DRAFT_831049 [Mycotypha africana]|uniref:uncharacterized protein n=1 Tax=Mycotypha africana TaxID=64632 RepID=UPI002300504C|nr:uncharacterized protein BDF20DRAFT_831049 [Mycotypha africana]KAI8990961.1 hypothetical protein BDF20DRAFT_831049 [Mycotypha africana]
MTVEHAQDSVLVGMHLNTEEEINEALAVLEEEIHLIFATAERRINDLSQRIDFVCAALRAQGNTQINRMLKSVRQLTIGEFCGTYEANTENFLNEQAKQRSVQNSKKSIAHVDDNEPEVDSLMKQRKSSTSVDGTEKNHAHPDAHEKENHRKANEIKECREADKETPLQNSQHQRPVERFTLRVNRGVLSDISVQLDPEYVDEDTDKLAVDLPEDIVNQLDKHQKERILKQIQQLQNTLSAFTETLG